MERLVERLTGILAEDECVLLAILHGSLLETDKPRDIDLAVYLDPRCPPTHLLDLIGRVEDATGLPADIQLLNEAPPSFTLHALREGVVLVEKQPLLTAQLYLRAVDELEFSRIAFRGSSRTAVNALKTTRV